MPKRTEKFRGSRTYHLVDKAVLLVDDGVATGTTMFAAIKWLKTQNLKTLIVAVPVGPLETIEKLRVSVDDVIVLYSPATFGSVGRFYQDFSQVTDDKVKEIMEKYRPEAYLTA